MSLSSSYHPQTNGQTERMNQSLVNALRCVVSKAPRHLEHVPALGRVCPKLPGLVNIRRLLLHGSCGLPGPPFDHQEEEAAVPSVRTHLCDTEESGSRCVHPSYAHPSALSLSLTIAWLQHPSFVRVNGRLQEAGTTVRRTI